MPSWWLRALTGVLVLLVVVTGVAVVVVEDGRDRAVGALTPWRIDSDRTTQHQEVAAAAEDLALAFLSVDHRDMDTLVDTVLAGATGQFASDYAAQRDRLVREARRARAVSVAEVVAVGVVEQDADTATVLVAADTVVQNRSTGNEGVARYYRLRLELVRDGERWLTEDVEFVR